MPDMPDLRQFGLPDIGIPFGGRGQRGGQPAGSGRSCLRLGLHRLEGRLILTNNHVVADANKVTVILSDRREFDAKVVGRDPTTDVAVIKIDGKNLPTVPLGNDETARVGDWVLAIGNPLGLDFTVTQGSSARRDVAASAASMTARTRSSITSRRTRRSTPAIRVVRSSTCVARSSA